MSDLQKFQESIDELVPKNVEVVRPEGSQNLVQIKKNVLLSFVSDATGCGHIRNVFPMTYLNAIFGKDQTITPIVSPIFIKQDDILARTKVILFQRNMSPEHYQHVLWYKQNQARYNYKMVYDIDDFIWGHNEKQGGNSEDGVPSYNFGWHGITEPIKKFSVEIIKLMDNVTVTSQFLKDYMENELGITCTISILPNAIPMYFWGNSRKAPKKKNIEKPRIVYTGSPTHYSNQEKLLGDLDTAFKDFIIKNVLNDKIEFVCMGDLPFCFEGIKNKVSVIGWLNSYQYHLGVKSINANFAIGPLVRNNFNYSKSNIKYQEMCAEGVPFIGSVFTNGKPSPYDLCELKVLDTCSVEDIEKIVFGLSGNFEEYNKVVKKQYEFMDRTGGFLESPAYVQKLVDNYF
jgi:hypothetical protein